MRKITYQDHKDIAQAIWHKLDDTVMMDTEESVSYFDEETCTMLKVGIICEFDAVHDDWERDIYGDYVPVECAFVTVIRGEAEGCLIKKELNNLLTN